MPRRPQLSRAAKIIERRMFLKAAALGLSVPAALRLARMATAATTAAAEALLPDVHPARHGARALQAEDQRDASIRRWQANYTDFALDQTNVSILGPLQPYKSYVNVYQGFQYPGAADTHTGHRELPVGLARPPTRRTRAHHRRARDRARRSTSSRSSSAPARTSRTASTRTGCCSGTGRRSIREKSPVKAFDTLFGGADHGAARRTPTCSCARTCSRSRRPRSRGCRRRCRA